MKKIPENKIRSRIVYISKEEFLFDASPKHNYTIFGEYEIDYSLVNAMGSDELSSSIFKERRFL